MVDAAFSKAPPYLARPIILPVICSKNSAMPENKALYNALCSTEYLPLHFQPWWLDAVCGPEYWTPVLAFDGGGRICGVLPCYIKRRWFGRAIQLAPFTTYAGPWLFYPETDTFKLNSRYGFEKKVCSDLIDKIPDVAFFLQNFRPEFNNWLPFYWKGFRQTTRYTYVFDQTADLQQITAGMKNTLRTDLKKARESVCCSRDDNAWEEMLRLTRLSLHKKGGKSLHSGAVFERLHGALRERGRSACFLARGRTDERLHAALYLVFDQRQAAVLLTGMDPAYKSSNAMCALWLEALRFCSERHLSLDFEGSMLPEIEHSFRALGARMQPYFQVWKSANRFLELLYQLRPAAKL